MMLSPIYREQVDLLLRILPFVAGETCFALKGGTAINLFLRDLPRLSVDIDLVYLPLDERDTAFANIGKALERIRESLTQALSGIQVRMDAPAGKLLCSLGRVQVKVEVNTVMRGAIAPTRLMPVSESVQEEFGRFTEIQVISDAEVYGGKICAALDRQHPRDLFDIFLLLEGVSLPEGIKPGFMAGLLSSDRPIHEMLSPRFQDQEQVFQTQFAGMTQISFTYDDFVNTRERLIKAIHSSLDDDNRDFLVSFKRGEPDWSLSPVEGLQNLPAIRWKLQNIQKLIAQNPAKHHAMLQRLEENLSRF